MPHRRPAPYFALVLAFSVYLEPAPVRAQLHEKAITNRAPVEADSAGPAHVIFSISGGISLGAYQAGVNWAMLQAFQLALREPSYPIDRIELATVTGASAGNINTLFWATEWCRRVPERGPLPPADSSLFWQLWVERADIGQLLPDTLAANAELGLLNRSALIGNLVNDLTARSMRTRDGDCELPIGITLTSVEPEVLEIPRARFEIQTQRFATIFRAVNDSTEFGRKLRFVPISLKPGFAESRFGKVFRLQAGADGIALTDLVDAVRASSSFPFAFSPVELRDAQGPRLFMDGGVFDNNPVALALALYENRIDSRRAPVVVYVNPGLTRPAETDSTRRQRAQEVAGGITPAWSLLRGAVSSARQYELQLLARDQQIIALNPSWVFSDRYAPLMGEHLGAFGAFLAYAFREHDFYVGVYDGLVLLAKRFSNCDEADTACVTMLVDSLRNDARLSIPSAGARLIDVLFRDEFREPDALKNFCTAGSWPGMTPEQPVPLAVACALRQRPAEGRSNCEAGDATSQLLCGDGLDRVFEELANRVDVLDACAEQCADSTRSEEARQLAGWIERPSVVGARLLDRVLARALDVERRAGTLYAKGERTDFEIPLEAVSLLYYASSLRRGNHLSSLPPGAHPAWHAWPNVITWGMREDALETRWEQLLYELLDWSLIAHYNHRPDHIDGAHFTMGMGLGPSLRGPRFIDRTGLVLSRFGVQAEVFAGEFADHFEGEWDPFAGWYGFIDFFAGKLRVSYRYMPEEGSLHGVGGNGWMVGFSDVKGSAYWAAQLLSRPGMR